MQHLTLIYLNRASTFCFFSSPHIVLAPNSEHSVLRSVLEAFAMLSFVCAALMVLYAPPPPPGSLDEFAAADQLPELGLFTPAENDEEQQDGEWFEEQLESDLKWSFALNGVLHSTKSEFQDVVLLDSKRFGKALIIDGKMQSAEKDEFIYHECLVHPALLLHDNPKTVFILGGGEGSTAREALRHKDVEKVIMCDIDKVVVDFCRAHLTENQEAFSDERLRLVLNDAKDELEKTAEKFDVIVSDLPDPIEGGPCNDLYTKGFYEQVIKPHLKDNGIFVTQSGPAGIFSHKDVFTSIYNTLKHVFKNVIAFTAHVPSYADSCAWVLASDQPIKLDVEELNSRIQDRIRGELLYLDGATIVSSTVMNKMIRTSLLKETQVLTGENARFVFGHGLTHGARENGA